MFRLVLLLVAIGKLAWCDSPPPYPPNLDRCASVFCVGVNREDCPGEYLDYHPPERCCSVCTVYKGLNESCARNQFPITVKCRSPYICKNDICVE
ncbi:hypothetical protein B7P43_G18107 [Cryptotermes secundus]|uniref:Single domain-containing protein n=1 Tax=Cryptotermes secundus TaxID=105785 RepID=A0A2J7QIF1_9NEOP|nr:hypothetical protein B7P43_G18107 [Cryptotermes secundus]